jgi:DNA-binding NarL/FixJ family response regulator
MSNKSVSILCVDDNDEVAEALRVKFSRAGGFDWKGRLATADDLVPLIDREAPRVVILDVDMPGRDPFEASLESSARFPNTFIVFFSGHLRWDYINRAIDCGAWGYISKNDGEDALIDAVRRVIAGEFVLSPEAREMYSSR